MIVSTIVAILVANSSLGNLYHHLLNETSIFGMSLHIFINDFLMAIFFLVAGCEIKHEILHGNLSSIKKASFPAIAAFGGVAVPALIFLLFNKNTQFSHGIGIPISTDIAFAIGIFMLLKSKLNSNLKVFLLSLAVVDDLISMLVIGVAYTSNINIFGIIGAISIMCILVYMNKILKVDKVFYYLLIGLFLWYFIYISGIHSTISGVLLSIFIPTKPNNNKLSVMETIQNKLTPICNYFILPLFAFANTGINLAVDIDYSQLSTLINGIIIGLAVGKPLGIMLFSYIGIKLNLTEKPKGASWLSLFQVSILAGIGFTMSILVSSLAFEYNVELIDISKISILLASILSITLVYITIILNSILSKTHIKKSLLLRKIR